MEEGAACGACLAEPPPFLAHRSAYLYEGPVRELLLLYKDAHRYPLAGLWGRAVARVVLQNWPGVRFDRVVPVPGTLARRLRRGFEPASLAAREAARALGAPFSRCLRLKRSPRPQKGLTASQRHENLRGAFRSVGALVRARVLLVDDVTTTGATLREAAKALSAAGAEVYAATAAMTPERVLDRVGAETPS